MAWEWPTTTGSPVKRRLTNAHRDFISTEDDQWGVTTQSASDWLKQVSLLKLWMHENHICELRSEELFEGRSSQLYTQLLHVVAKRKPGHEKNSGRKRGSRTRVDWNGERKYRHSFLLCFLNKCHQIVRHDALLPLWLKKKSTSHGTFNQNLGYLHVRHVLIKETSFFESKHIYFIINLSLAFLSRCFCSFYLVSKRFTIEFRHVLNRLLLAWRPFARYW